MKGLRALQVAEERELAGRVAGLLYLVGAATVILLLLVPGVETSEWTIVLAISAVAAAWGLLCLFVIPWRRVNPLLSHLSSGLGLPLTAVAMAATGGADSPARFYLLFIVFYASYFYPPREAIPHLVGCIAVLLLPLTYDSNAVDQGLLGETLVLVPSFFVLGGLIMGGKRIMLELARHDALTGLMNRRAFGERLEEGLRRRRRSDSFGLLLCDLDDFKEVNTRHGHPGGDRALCEAATALRAAVRDGDLVARLGGDEFAIVATAADDEGMAALAERVRAELREANERLGLSDRELSASFGWALFPKDAESSEGLVACADLALRNAKEAGQQAGRYGTVSSATPTAS
jgi:diguanylate cyclase (GGDEF)-like protein